MRKPLYFVGFCLFGIVRTPTLYTKIQTVRIIPHEKWGLRPASAAITPPDSAPRTFRHAAIATTMGTYI